jgi:hypothetical protein
LHIVQLYFSNPNNPFIPPTIQATVSKIDHLNHIPHVARVHKRNVLGRSGIWLTPGLST